MKFSNLGRFIKHESDVKASTPVEVGFSSLSDSLPMPRGLRASTGLFASNRASISAKLST